MDRVEFSIKEKDLIEFKKRRYVRLEVQKALRKGIIKKTDTCSLCAHKSSEIEAHHVDYGKPFEITWLCSSCHGRVHRSNHPLNPNNNPQTAITCMSDQVQKVSVNIALPIQNFLTLKHEADRKKTSVSSLIRVEIEKLFPVQKNQLEFSFMKEKNDPAKPLYENLRTAPTFKLSNIQSVGSDEGCLRQSQFPLLLQIRRDGDILRSSMDEFPCFSGRYGGDARPLQRSGTTG